MNRLVDYFAVVGYDSDAEGKDHALRGKVLVRIPDTDWKDAPFTSGIELIGDYYHTHLVLKNYQGYYNQPNSNFSEVELLPIFADFYQNIALKDSYRARNMKKILQKFCQPGGWYLSREKEPPTFFVSVLTDEQGNQQYCAVHSFSEPLRVPSPAHSRLQRKRHSTITNHSIYRSKSDSDVTENGFHHSEAHGEDYIDEDMCRVESGDIDFIGEPMNSDENKTDAKNTYAPKCLVLLSRVHDFRVLKNCLGLIYTIYIEGLSQSIENVIAKLLLVKVPPPGSSQLRFSIGAADKQALQPPQNNQLPLTRSSVTMLLRQLGILNVLNILCAALVDQKLLFYSCSYTRLTEACNALTALMYPFKYSYPYIPILPRHLLECTSSPTPFLIGVHSSFKTELTELLDVITVDLDGGVISIPECLSIPVIPEPYYTSVVEALTKVLCPDLVVADWAYPPEQARTSEPERLDKEIRAIFLRLFCQLLMGYRSCLQVCRIHPRPIIRFLKESFLTMRGFDFTNTTSASEFVPKLLNSQAFSLFVQDNGPPYRRLHLFDEVVSQTPERIQTDITNVYQALKHIKVLASDLYMNENPNHLPLTERIPKPSEGSFNRPNQLFFPKLSCTAVQTFMEECKSGGERERQLKYTRQTRRRVPEGNRPISIAGRMGALAASNRRLEVLRNCLSFIFESKTLEIKKIFQAVIRALKSRAVRSGLSQELTSYAKTRALLDEQQFDYIARLINSALHDSSGQLDENTLASDMLPVVTSFHRKLGPTVTQFMYSVTQDHPVWSSSPFWESTFFDDIQDEIRSLYKDSVKKKTVSKVTVRNRLQDQSPSRRAGTDFSSGTATQPANQWEVQGRRDNQLCMEIAAVELQQWEEKTPKEQEEISSAEEGVVFSQAMHNAQRMVFMLVPLDSSRINRSKFLRSPAGEENSSYFTGSLTGSLNGSFDEESGFDESQDAGSDVAASVSKFICRFVDRVCSEACINNEHTKMLLNKIPTLVHMQVESLQDVCRESKRLPPIMKPKLLQPKLLLGETLALEKPYRTFLFGDGRCVATGGDIGGPSLLPAEGALFVTTYRVIFIGVPCDALAAEQVVIRSFPASTLFKVKTFNVHDHPRISDNDNSLQHGIQLRSSTFQLLILSFDEEVTTEEQDHLQKELHRLRYPSTIEGAYALSAPRFAQLAAHQAPNVPLRTKSGPSGAAPNVISGSRMSGAKTLYKQAKRKAGLDKSNRISRLIAPDTKTRTLYYNSSSVASAGPSSTSTLGRMPAIDEAMTKTLSDKDTMNRLIQRSCEADYRRMKLISANSTAFRLSRVNRMFSVCRSHPACVVVPHSTTDEQVKSLAHCHRQSRFPSAVWIHPGTNAVLLRSSAIQSRTAGSLFKRGQSKPMGSDEGTMGSSSEEERFLLKIASMVVLPSRPVSALFRPSSVSSLASMEEEVNQSPPALVRGSSGSGPALSTSSRFNRSKKWSTLTRSNGKLGGDAPTKSPVNSRSLSVAHPSNGTLTQTAIYNAMSRQAQLYVFGDKGQLKSLKHEQQGKVMFVPVELAEPKQIRMSYKALIKSCLPADPPAIPASSSSSQQIQDTMSNYLKEVQDSLWMELVSQLIQTAGSVVDVMDIHGASVMLAIDDGTDIVPLLSSLSQLLMDSYYRTMEGFQTLVQKEWLSFGHRFCHRNRFNDIESSGFTPVFLMFLDAVYQVHRQFPMSFEFNEMYLEVIAYHFMSNRFTTFLLDSDFERLEAGILFEKKKRTRTSTRTSVTSDNSESSVSPVRSGNGQIKSLWEYLDAAHSRSPVFFNPLYCPDYLPSQILRPISCACRLSVWPYYFKEALGEGPPYDGLLGELTAGTSHNEQEATEASEAWGGATGRRVVNGCYDNVADAQPDSIKMLLNKLEGLQGELNLTVEPWQAEWGRVANANAQTRKTPDDVVRSRSEVRALHKQMTVDVIHKNQPKPKRRSSSRSRPAIPEEGNASDKSAQETSDADTASLGEHMGREVPVFQISSVDEVRTYEGSLWKQGAFMKGWKLRFFVLDTTKHELRQYENSGENVSKNIIDLKDLESVQRIDSVTSAPKTASEKACFEVKISKRLYHFIAESEQAADEWVDNLQATLQ